MEENILGIAISYLEEHGIDTSNMSVEEILQKYNELLTEESGNTTEQVAEEISADVVEDVVDDEAIDIDKFLEENADIIGTLNEEQKAVFDKLIDLFR